MTLLHVDKLSVSYGRVRALDEVDLEIGGEGALHGVIGPNGAGKSTLLDAISGRRRPTRGVVRYRGEDITRRSVAWRRRHGMSRSFQRTSIFQDLTVLEQLRLVAEHLRDNRLADVVEVMNLADYLHEKAGRIAYGVQRRVDVALALIGRPQLLLMDEPGAGLSASETLGLFRHLRELVRDRSITAVVVEHDVDAVFACCDIVTVLDLGKHLTTGSPVEIRADTRVVAAYLGSAA
jgi:branched-chain amino acid transport system ATP-binding protein